jgi:hypothetical protein
MMDVVVELEPASQDVSVNWFTVGAAKARKSNSEMAPHEYAKLHGLNLANDQEIDDYAKARQSCSSFTRASARSDGSAKNEVGSNSRG